MIWKRDSFFDRVLIFRNWPAVGFSSRSLLFLAAGLLAISPACRPSILISPNLPGVEDSLHFDTPSETWDEAIPLGNGMVGTLLWGDGAPLHLSLDRADLWDLRKVPEFYSDEYDFETMRRWHEEGNIEDQLRVYEQPYNRPAPTKIPAGRIELLFGKAEPSFKAAELRLIDAVARVELEEGTYLDTFIHATRPVGLIRSNNQPEIRLVAPDFAGEVERPASGGIDAGDLAQLGYPAPQFVQESERIAFFQEGAEGFQFAVEVGWRRVDAGWLAAWSIASTFESPNPQVMVRNRVSAALEQGWDALHFSHSEWWSRFWKASSVALPNPQLERLWFLEQYKFGSASRRGAPPISLQAVWTADNGGLPPWKGDYHHDLNTELSYWPCYTGNHLEEGLAYLDWLWDTRQEGIDWTSRFFKMPGLNVPMTADLMGRQIGGWRQYTHSATTAAWLSQHFYWHWKYSKDHEFLSSRAYPYLKEASIFLEAFTDGQDEHGKRTFPLSSSPEINDNRPSAWFPKATNYDVSLSRWLFAAAAELAAELGLNEEEHRWRKVLAELPELAAGDEGLLVAPGYPLQSSHRHFSHLMAIHPLGMIDPSNGSEEAGLISSSLHNLETLGSDWWTGYSFSWLANLQARARNGEKAEEALEIFTRAFTLRSSFHCNGDQSGEGFSRFTYRPFTLEGNFAAAAGIQEMLLQSHGDTILVFPAIPEAWEDVAFSTLRAQGAFLVSASRSKGQVDRIEILSERGGKLRIAVPPFEKVISRETTPGERIILAGPSALNS
ncbi:MAG: hypothetical protein JSU96_19805 [Acidobacteriota bacterium]|nr:MAG: hypothetical protein JSU96_19805 [Acidobacteriota bacterium]